MQLFFLSYLENFKAKPTPKQHFLEADKNRGGGRAACLACGYQRERLEQARRFWEKETGIDCKAPADFNAGRSVVFIYSCHCLIRIKSNLLNLMVLSYNVPLCFPVKQIVLVALEVWRIRSFKKLMTNISILSIDNSKLQLYCSQHVSSKYSEGCSLTYLIA